MADTKRPSGGRWAPICQECWDLVNGDQYFPEWTGFAECAVCGEDAGIVNVHPEVAAEAWDVRKAEQDAKVSA